jgi:hypothetical protein
VEEMGSTGEGTCVVVLSERARVTVTVTALHFAPLHPPLPFYLPACHKPAVRSGNGPRFRPAGLVPARPAYPPAPAARSGGGGGRGSICTPGSLPCPGQPTVSVDRTRIDRTRIDLIATKWRLRVSGPAT